MVGLKIFFDGGCRPNPGAMELAVVIRGVAHVARALGPGTSMDAEWLALIHALRLAQQAGVAEPLLLGDARAVVEQVHGHVRCPGAYRQHYDAFHVLAVATPDVRVRHVKRAQNLAGIVLAKARA